MVDGNLDDAITSIEDHLVDFELDEAEEMLEEARRAFGFAPELVAMKAEIALERGDYRTCLDLADASDIEQDGAAARLLAQQGFALYYLDREDEARELFNRAVRRDPECWDALLGRAMVHEYMDYSRAAMLDLDRLIEMDDQAPEPFAIRGALLSEAGEYEEARSDLEWAIELAPYDEEARLELARLEALQDEPNEAIETLTPLVEEGEDPDFVVPGVLLRSQMLLNFKDIETALDDADIAVERASDEPWGYLQRAACHVTAGTPEDALEALDRAHERIEGDPREVPDYFELRAAALDHLGRDEEAAEARDRAEGTSRLPEIVYGPSLNPARHVPVNPEHPFDIRQILEELFGDVQNAPEGYPDKLRDLMDRISEVAEENPGAREIEIELPPIEEGGASPGELVLEREEGPGDEFGL